LRLVADHANREGADRTGGSGGYGSSWQVSMSNNLNSRHAVSAPLQPFPVRTEYLISAFSG
jgi:hypothetical protein